MTGPHRRQRIPTDRRTFLRSLAGAGLATSLAGCNVEVNTGPGSTSFAANPAGLDADAGQEGYELLDHRQVSRSLSTSASATDATEAPEITITDQIASYRRSNATISPDALAILATPDAAVEGTQHNSLTQDSLQDIVAGRSVAIHPWTHTTADAEAVTKALPLLYGGSPESTGWKRGPTQVASREGTLLDQTTGLTSFAGVTDNDIFVLTHATRVSVEEMAVLVVGIHTRDASQNTGKSFVGSNGFVTQSELDQTARTTASALEYVILGRVPELSSSQSGILQVVDEQLSVTGSGVAERVSLRIRAKNVSKQPLEYVELVPEFYDSSGELLTIERGEQFFVDPGETLEQHIPIDATSAEIASRSLSANVKGAKDAETLNGVTIQSDRLQTSDVDAYVEGTVQNNGQAQEYVGIRAKFYANGHLVDSGDAHATDLSAGDSWDFTVEYSADGHEPFTSITDYSVELVGKWWWPQY